MVFVHTVLYSFSSKIVLSQYVPKMVTNYAAQAESYRSRVDSLRSERDEVLSERSSINARIRAAEQTRDFGTADDLRERRRQLSNTVDRLNVSIRKSSQLASKREAQAEARLTGTPRVRDENLTKQTPGINVSLSRQSATATLPTFARNYLESQIPQPPRGLSFTREQASRIASTRRGVFTVFEQNETPEGIETITGTITNLRSPGKKIRALDLSTTQNRERALEVARSGAYSNVGAIFSGSPVEQKSNITPSLPKQERTFYGGLRIRGKIPDSIPPTFSEKVVSGTTPGQKQLSNLGVKLVDFGEGLARTPVTNVTIATGRKPSTGLGGRGVVYTGRAIRGFGQQLRDKPLQTTIVEPLAFYTGGRVIGAVGGKVFNFQGRRVLNTFGAGAASRYIASTKGAAALAAPVISGAALISASPEQLGRGALAIPSFGAGLSQGFAAQRPGVQVVSISRTRFGQESLQAVTAKSGATRFVSVTPTQATAQVSVFGKVRPFPVQGITTITGSSKTGGFFAVQQQAKQLIQTPIRDFQTSQTLAGTFDPRTGQIFTRGGGRTFLSTTSSPVNRVEGVAGQIQSLRSDYVLGGRGGRLLDVGQATKVSEFVRSEPGFLSAQFRIGTTQLPSGRVASLTRINVPRSNPTPSRTLGGLFSSRRAGLNIPQLPRPVSPPSITGVNNLPFSAVPLGVASGSTFSPSLNFLLRPNTRTTARALEIQQPGRTLRQQNLISQTSRLDRATDLLRDAGLDLGRTSRANTVTRTGGGTRSITQTGLVQLTGNPLRTIQATRSSTRSGGNLTNFNFSNVDILPPNFVPPEFLYRPKKSKAKKSKGGRGFAYAPSLTAGLLGITTRKAPKTITGFELRPLLR